MSDEQQCPLTPEKAFKLIDNQEHMIKAINRLETKLTEVSEELSARGPKIQRIEPLANKVNELCMKVAQGRMLVAVIVVMMPFWVTLFAFLLEYFKKNI